MRGFEDDDILRRLQHAPPQSLSADKLAMCAAIVLAWLLFGVWGRDAWKPEETQLITLAAGLARGDEVFFSLLARHYADSPPLYVWLCAQAASLWPAQPFAAARAFNVLLMGGGVLLTFGAAAGGGTRVAAAAALLAAATPSMVVRSHLLDSGAPAFFGMALFLLGARWLAARPLAGGAVCGGALAFLFLGAGVLHAAAAAAAAAMFILWRAQRRRVAAGVLALAVFAAPLLLLSPAFLQAAYPPTAGMDDILTAQMDKLPAVNEIPARLAEGLKLTLWALFPNWAIVVGGLMILKRRLFATAVSRAAASAFIAAWMVGLAIGGDETDLFFAAPPLAVLAAEAACRLPPRRLLALDWFALLGVGAVFVAGQGALWAGWRLGLDISPVHWVAAFRPGYTGGAGALSALLALCTIALWILAVRKFGHSNDRVVFNWSASLAACWIIFSLLWLDFVDHGKSYRRAAQNIIAAAPLDACIQPRNLSAPQVSQLLYFGAPLRDDDNCALILRAQKQADAAPLESNTAALWRGGRFEGDSEYFTLFYR